MTSAPRALRPTCKHLPSLKSVPSLESLATHKVYSEDSRADAQADPSHFVGFVMLPIKLQH